MADLNKIQIGNDSFNIPNGGGAVSVIAKNSVTLDPSSPGGLGEIVSVDQGVYMVNASLSLVMDYGKSGIFSTSLYVGATDESIGLPIVQEDIHATLPPITYDSLYTSAINVAGIVDLTIDGKIGIVWSITPWRQSSLSDIVSAKLYYKITKLG